MATRESHGHDQPIDIFPAITHFTDAITSLPKDLVRHFTLLKEVDAKIFAPEETLFQLVNAALKSNPPEARQTSDAASSGAPASAPMSAQSSAHGFATNGGLPSAPSADEQYNASLYDQANVPRRQLFRQTAFKIQEMLVSLEEKNHVISTANEALSKQLARIDDVWPHLEGEFSDEAKWGSTTHWAYPENRISRANAAERSRRDGASAITAAAQQLAEEAAARSDARKQAVAAKKGLKTQQQQQQHQQLLQQQQHQHQPPPPPPQQQQQQQQQHQPQQPQQHHDSDVDADHDINNNTNNTPSHNKSHRSEPAKKANGNSKSRKAVEPPAPVGLGITTGLAANGNPPPKKRKVDNSKDKAQNGGQPMERALSAMLGNTAPKGRTSSPRATPTPDAGSAPPSKKRKALPTVNGQAKKSKNGFPSTLSPQIGASSPVASNFPDPKTVGRSSPAPPSTAAARPSSSRARQNSTASNADTAKIRPPAVPHRPNGAAAPTPDTTPQQNGFKPSTHEVKPPKDVPAPVKIESTKETTPQPVVAVSAATSGSRKNSIAKEDADSKTDNSLAVQQTVTTIVTTKSGRASKPSTPALGNFPEHARARSARNNHTDKAKRSHKKGASLQAALAAQAVDEDAEGGAHGDDDGDIDANEPRYCYCDGVSYGEMVACDADDCEKEWFHLGCVGLKSAPGSSTKWYCDNCKNHVKNGKKVNSR